MDIVEVEQLIRKYKMLEGMYAELVKMNIHEIIIHTEDKNGMVLLDENTRENCMIKLKDVFLSELHHSKRIIEERIEKWQ